MFEIISDSSAKLSKVVISYSGIKFSEFSKLLKNKDIKVNGKRTSCDLSLSVGDVITVYANLEEPLVCQTHDVIFEDDNILVVDKYKGVNSDTLYSELSKNTELYYIHRLDLNTDGVMIFAKNTLAESELKKGFKNRTFDKSYLALVYGFFDKKEGLLSDYLIKDEDSSTVKIIRNKTRSALTVKTQYFVLKTGRETSLLKVNLLTGRTHQIRAHLAFYGHFIIGDGKYGKEEINRKLKVKKQQLSSYSLTLHFEENSPLKYLDNKTFTANKKIEVL